MKNLLGLHQLTYCKYMRIFLKFEILNQHLCNDYYEMWAKVFFFYIFGIVECTLYLLKLALSFTSLSDFGLCKNVANIPPKMKINIHAQIYSTQSTLNAYNKNVKFCINLVEWQMHFINSSCVQKI